MDEKKFHRQLGIVDMERLSSLNILLIGAGGIGCPVAIGLIKMGVDKITIIDDDELEIHNLPNTMYPDRMLGMPKVTALAQLLDDYSATVAVRTIQKRITHQEDLNLDGYDIVIVAPDNMELRKLVAETMVEEMSGALLIDARMAAQMFNVFTVNMTDEEARDKYLGTICPDSEADTGTCTAKAIIYNTMGIAAQVCNQVKKFVNNETLNYVVRGDYNIMVQLVE